jgi:saccharopine dehydrogenase-like NADP-dependent oxidoreductase
MALTNILVAGAGKSATWLIKYLLDDARKNGWQVTVADGNAALIAEKTANHPAARAAAFDITSVKERQALVKDADIVVSLMPPHLHILLAEDCVRFRKNLITSSYISPEMKALDEAARKEGLMFMCEMGLDPGIDHMSANHIIHGIQRVAGEITSFKSYCGGLIAQESDDNPWHYKFSWNPRNIIDAGKAGAAYLEKGKNKEVGYQDMFNARDLVEVDGAGSLAWYPNRDSLKYLDIYEVPDVTTFLRATFRHPDFCAGWQALIRLGLTDTENAIPEHIKTYADLLAALNGFANGVNNLRESAAGKLNLKYNGRVMNMISWLGLFERDALPESARTPGDALLQLLEQKWAMRPEDKDLVVMQHEVGYSHRGRQHMLISSLVIEGENRELSAMAKTVGLPMGILAKLVLQKRVIPPHGVLLPGMSSVYKPVLAELARHGIDFKEKVS